MNAKLAYSRGRKPPPPDFPDAELVRDISVEVYKERLGPANLTKMLEERGADVLRANAGSYDGLTRAYLRAFRNILPERK